MEQFPFSEAEWATVKEAALPVVNAGLAEDPALRTSRLPRLLDVLAGLRARHGDHPVLLETQAEFVEDDDERVHLYRRAATIADEHGLATLSIRLSLARVLLETGSPTAAVAELVACESELGEGDESERDQWAELVEEARQADSTTAPGR